MEKPKDFYRDWSINKLLNREENLPLLASWTEKGLILSEPYFCQELNNDQVLKIVKLILQGHGLINLDPFSTEDKSMPPTK